VCGSKRGARVLLGNIEDSKWDQIAVVRYPRLATFGEMLDFGEYTAMNEKSIEEWVRDAVLACLSR
jgi:hypothetical protein